MAKGITFDHISGTGKKVGIVRTMWNKSTVDKAVDECLRALDDAHVNREDIVIYNVPGAYELPRGAKEMIERESVDAIVCIGVLVKGETKHFEYISEAVTQAIMHLNIHGKVPVIYGILNCLSEEQAIQRLKHGYEWGLSAVHMSMLGQHDRGIQT